MIGIVAVGYNRPDSIRLLLESLAVADYAEDNVDLIISIDKGANQQSVIDVANHLIWKHGEKVIRAFSEKQGLRKHIMQCGDLTETYDAVIVLEDDLIVSKAFYKYVKAAICFYDNDPSIAGISLYSYRVNEFCEIPFTPAYNGFDAYIMQVAQSWGQCWTKKMWSEFKAWPQSDADFLQDGTDMPQQVYHWGKTSWKKNYMAYIVQKNKYFVYPYYSLTTNKSEAGTHRQSHTSDYQVPLIEDQNIWRFPNSSEAIAYDVFFERQKINAEIMGLNGKVCMDLYGLKHVYKEYNYLFSRNRLPYKVVKEIGLDYRPHEENCIRMIAGEGLYLYDLSKNDSLPKSKNNRFTYYEYLIPGANWHFSLKYGFFGFRRAIKRRVTK